MLISTKSVTSWHLSKKNYTCGHEDAKISFKNKATHCSVLVSSGGVTVFLRYTA